MTRLLAVALAWAAGLLGAPATGVVYRVPLEDEAITPVAARFVARAIEAAERDRAHCLVLVLDTPGGLADSTRDMTRRILESRVPVVVYVAPPGGRAASAGVFITAAAHVAAMAPGTNIGAAYPVQMGGTPGGPQDGQQEGKQGETTPMEKKAVNDTVSWVRSLAELRGRNAEWLSRAVTEAASASATEAVENNVVDIVAADMDDLLRQLDGREVALPDGKVKLRVAGADLRTYEMWWGDRILSVLANPNIALLLMMLGFYGVLLEFYSPGWGIAGTLGIIFLLLGFFSMAVLPINYAGLLLLALGLALMAAEAFFTSYGALAIGGVVCMTVGGLMLVDSPSGFLRVSIWTIAPVALATAAITVFLLTRIIRAHGLPSRTGSDGLPGMQAVAQDGFVSEDGYHAGFVRAHGELWRAISKEPVEAGQILRVEGAQGLTLRVTPKGGEELPTKEGG